QASGSDQRQKDIEGCLGSLVPVSTVINDDIQEPPFEVLLRNALESVPVALVRVVIQLDPLTGGLSFQVCVQRRNALAPYVQAHQACGRVPRFEERNRSK